MATATGIPAALACWSASVIAEGDPPVKLSRNGICHERGTSAYGATLHYERFEHEMERDSTLSRQDVVTAALQRYRRDNA